MEEPNLLEIGTNPSIPIIPNSPCQICKTNPFKYKCPKCLYKTCSLLCVKSHKKKFDCSGVKDKFNPKFKTEEDLRKDLRFLNEGLRVTNNSSKKVFHMSETSDIKKEREKKNKYLRKCAKKFRSINLLSCPSAMTRFSENHSYVDFKNKKFYWTVKFIFISENNIRHEHIFPDVFDDLQYCLNDLIKNFRENKQNMDLKLLLFINELYEQGEETNLRKDSSGNNVLEESQVLYRINMKENQIKGKIVKLNKIIYEECDKNMLLKDMLEGKDILEYPEFIFLLNKKGGSCTNK